MRVLLKVTIPTEAGNKGFKNGTLPKTFQSILEDLRPEAVYFAAVDGKRTGFIVHDLPDPSHIPAVCEPWFLAFNATTDLYPVMTPEDLARAGAGIERAVERYA